MVDTVTQQNGGSIVVVTNRKPLVSILDGCSITTEHLCNHTSLTKLMFCVLSSYFGIQTDGENDFICFF
jgi:hypothetical protein